MLVLTRKAGQSVYIGDDIKITLHNIRGNQVRIGIHAPPSVKIYREEIYLQILEENKLAATDVPENLEGVARDWSDNKPKAIATLSSYKKKSRSEDEEA